MKAFARQLLRCSRVVGATMLLFSSKVDTFCTAEVMFMSKLRVDRQGVGFGTQRDTFDL